MSKFKEFNQAIHKNYTKDIIVNLSPPMCYRYRCEFRYMNNRYVMFNDNKKIYIKKLNIAAKPIQKIMPLLLQEINKYNEIKEKLYQINFRSNSLNQVTVSLIYHKQVNNNLTKNIIKLSDAYDININIRSKKFLYSVNSKYIEDILIYKNLKTYQTDTCFYQPNIYLLNKMISKVMSFTKKPKDLLELYCGVGTFSLPLSFIFNKVLVTENNRSSIRCLNKALINNNIKNISYGRLSSSEVVKFFEGKNFYRMRDTNINQYNFSHVLVDPPRSGLTMDVIKFISKFKNILYISCSPETYLRDIQLLKKHKITNIEIFDQFPNTKHFEIISALSVN